jgi:hypothetical protein
VTDSACCSEHPAQQRQHGIVTFSKVELPDARSGDDERGAEFGMGAFQVDHFIWWN